MTGPEFARHLGAWLSPAVLAEAAAQLRDDPARSGSSVTMYIASPVLESGDEAGLAWLIQLYLDHFSVPPNVLLIARAFWGRHLSDPAVVSRLGALRFRGKLLREVEPPAEAPLRPLLALESTRLEWLLVKNQVNMLTRLVSDLAFSLKDISKRIPHGRAVHQELSHDSPLAVFVEAVVGRAYGLSRFGEAAAATQIYATLSTPRRSTYHGPEPVKDAITLAMLQSLAEARKTELPRVYPDDWNAA